MYYPFGWPKCFKTFHKSTVIELVSNTDKTLMLMLSGASVSIWFTKPSLELVRHERNKKSLQHLGDNLHAVWRPDSSMIVIITNKHYLLFYKVESSKKSSQLFQQDDVGVSNLKRESAELFLNEKIPALQLILAYSTQILSGISCIMAAEEELVLGTQKSEICGINWNGTVDESFLWHLPTLKNSSEREQLNVIDIKYSSMIAGFSFVFNDGSAGFMPLHSRPTNNTSSELSSKLQFVPDINNAICTSINHKYQIIVYGLKNAEGILCCLDEQPNTSVNAIVVTHRLVLSASTFPDAKSRAGAMVCFQWTPDSTVLATAWQKGGFALWSVFGALITCSLSWDYGASSSITSNPFTVLSVAWGREGYHLWLATKNNKPKEEENGHLVVTEGVSQLSMAKSIISSNPSSASSSELVLLMADDRLFVGIGAVNVNKPESIGGVSNPVFSRANSLSFTNGTSSSDENLSLLTSAISAATICSSSPTYREQHPIEIGNHQWLVVPVSQRYLASNWPIRYATLDANGHNLAIAGKTGIACYSFANRKWKLFGNETQEKNFEVCGELVFWEEYIVLSCYNLSDLRYEIRCYPHQSKLDDQYLRVTEVPNEVLHLSIFSNRLLTFLIDGSMHLFILHRKNSALNGSNAQASSSSESSSHDNLHIIHVNEIVVSNLKVPAECVTAIVLTKLHIDQAKSDESILMNVCGRVFLLESERPNQALNGTGGGIAYKAVSILASGVEHFWVPNFANVLATTGQQAPLGASDRPHLTQSLWLSCGANGMGVWLPLLPRDGDNQKSTKNHSFTSKRIMIPIRVHIYPLSVLFHDAVVLGAENDTILYGKNCPINFPMSVVSRTSQVYLHHILRELLRKNLGQHAWNLANTCTDLPYFPHSLELLLHEVLEEEATSHLPIPDALLPRVVDFLREFPVFLQTIVHCARKTEYALWPHLFSVVGTPKELFQKCIANGQLETAASCIIILQNLDGMLVSKHYASMLHEACIEAKNLDLAKHVARFLKTIESTETVDSPPVKTTTNSPPFYPPVKFKFPNTSSLHDGVTNPSTGGRVRCDSVSFSETKHKL